MDRARFVAFGVLTQAVELAGPEPSRLGQQLVAEGALSEMGHVEQMGSRRHDHLIAVGDRGRGTGESEWVAELDVEWADEDHAAHCGR